MRSDKPVFEAEGAQVRGESRVLGGRAVHRGGPAWLHVFDGQDVLEREVRVAGRLGDLLDGDLALHDVHPARQCGVGAGRRDHP